MDLSENGKNEVSAGAVAQIIIQLKADGNHVAIIGPLGEKGLCYQMLELAKDVVRNYKSGSGLIIKDPGENGKTQ
jgi:hypothetical protein